MIFCFKGVKKWNSKQVFVTRRKNHAWNAFKEGWLFPRALVEHLLKTKKEYKNLKKQESQDILPKRIR